MPESSDHVSAFVQYLEGLVEAGDRAPLAALRRGLGKPPETATEVHRYVVPWLPPDVYGGGAANYYLVASLFALWYQGQASVARLEGTLGRSFRSLAHKVAAEQGKPAGEGIGTSIERRFVALLTAHHDDVPEHMRHAVSLLRSKEVPVDWARLMRDLARWDRYERPVQRRWARDFWAHKGEPAEPGQQPAKGGHDAH